MLAGIYYGAQCGGSTTAILINLPGEVSAVVTCIDGHQMSRQGKAGKALGIPPNSVLAMMLGAMIIHGIQPGPQIVSSNPQLFWGVIASIWVGNAMLLVPNLPLIGMWVKMLDVPYRRLYPAIVIFCRIGVYSISNMAVDVLIAAAFGFIGYLFIKLGCEPAPLLLGFVLGPMLEENFRRALLRSHGDPLIFVRRPISATLRAFALVLMPLVLAPNIGRKRRDAFRKE